MLGVIVYQQHPVSGLCKTDTQIDGGSGFSNTSLLIDNGNGFAVVHFVPPIVILLIFLLHQNTENLSALWSVRFIRPRPPKHTKGNHLTLESESSPWAFHPCRVLRQLRREVSLSYLNHRRLVGGNPTLETAFLAQHLCFSPHRLPRFVPLTGQVVTAYCPPGSGPEECIR